MKKLKMQMIAAAACTLMLAACSNDEAAPSGADATGMARFSATIDGTATRAYDQNWEQDDEIGISGTSGDATYTNVCYWTTDGTGSFTPTNESGKIYYQTDEEVTFKAYYPWNNLQDGTTTITADTREQKNQKKFDFLWAQAKGSKENPNVAFKFAHKMAKVVLTIKKGSDVSYEEIKAVVPALAGFKNAGTFNVEDGATATTGDAILAWTFGNTENEEYNALFNNDDEYETVSYTLIFFPQEFESELTFTATLTDKQSFTAKLDFKNANAEKDDDNAKNEWVAGRQYNMGIVLNKTGITVEGCTIDKWEEVNGGNMDAQ